jgi:putative transposase
VTTRTPLVVPHIEDEDPVQVKRAYKFLLRPTAKQAAAFEACLEDHRLLYNAALEERREAWRMRRTSLNYYAQAAQLPAIRAADPRGQGRWSAGSQQQTLRRLDRAFAAFFRRIRAGEAPGYPRFKGRGWFDTVEWPAQKNGARWDSVPHPSVTRVYLLGVGHVRVHQHRAVQGAVKTVSVKREANRWYVILACDDVPAQPLPATGAVVGIDMGVASFLTTSAGVHVPNPHPLATAADRLVAAQQSLARKQRGSKRRRKAVAKVAALHGKVRRVRLDHASKTALELVRDHDLIAHEALKVASMTRRPAPQLAVDGNYEPNGAAAKTALNKSILDAGWGVFLRILAAKAESAGRIVVAVDPRHTSQRCAACGHVAAGNRATQAEFRCLSCGHEVHADVNAAVNILRAGLVLQAAEAA